MDRRFAIVIGINDYEKSPLNYCCKDAEAIANILKEKCRFSEDNIFKITSETSDSIKDISGHLDKALKKISENFRPNLDSVFFYFAGHGQNLNEKSYIVFHDSNVQITTIFEKISELQPKTQTYVIDACESGGKVITRKSTSNESLIGLYIKQSSGVLLMLAATEKQFAFEQTKKEHGIFTFYFLAAVNNPNLYDEDGILTPGRIHDYIARELGKQNQFDQTPVLESRFVGYYPFAFKTQDHKELQNKIIQDDLPQKLEPVRQNLTQEYFPDVPFKIRVNVFEEIKPIILNSLETFVLQFANIGYEIKSDTTTDIFGYDLSEKIISDLIASTKTNDVFAMHGVFTQTREEIKSNPVFGALGFFSAFNKQNEPSFKNINTINFDNSKALCFSIYLKASSVTKVSAGIIILVYQAVYGVGLVIASFNYDNKSYKETNIIGPRCNVLPFKYNDKTINNILEKIEEGLNKFSNDINYWNNNRQKEINSFSSKTE